MINDLFKPFSLFSEPSSEGNKKQPEPLIDFKDPPNLNQNFMEESVEREYWISQLSPTLSGVQPRSPFNFNSDFIQQPIVNSSPYLTPSNNVEVLAVYHTSKKENTNNLVLKSARQNEISRARKNFSEENAKVLKKWLLDHKDYPYPTLDQVNNLCQLTGLTSKQIRTFFVNNRSRLLFRSPKGGKVIKSRKILKEEEENAQASDDFQKDQDQKESDSEEDEPCKAKDTKNNGNNVINFPDLFEY